MAVVINGCRKGETDLNQRVASGPNVVLIVLDTTRADYFSCYGYKRRTTPRIDQIAAEGAQFRRAFATDFWTLPSHATILTGRYPTDAGATAKTLQLADSNQTLAEILHDAGYQTGAVVCNGWLSAERKFAQGFDFYLEMWRSENLPGPDAPPEAREHPAVDRAVDWIKRVGHQSAPFLLFVNVNLAHLPYAPSVGYRRRFLDRRYEAKRVEEIMQIRLEWPHIVGEIELDDQDFEIMRGLYAANIAMLDDWVGVLMDALNDHGILDDTLVVITSDHGENLGDHDMIGHILSMYETTLHVPLIMRYPKRIAAGQEFDELVSLVDLAPTILDLCGLEGKSSNLNGNGQSLFDSNREKRTHVFAENPARPDELDFIRRKYPDYDPSTLKRPVQMIRDDRHRLVLFQDGRSELYDLLFDPQERHDVSQEKPVLREELMGQLQAWSENLQEPGDVELLVSEDPETLRKLCDLGYVECK